MDETTRGTRIRLLAGAAVLAVLVLRVGPEPFLDGLAHTDLRALAYALVVTAATTACCARRWSLVAGGLGVGLAFGPAYRACYRAQVLNVTLPGGVAGDVHRGYRHGKDAGALGRGLRSVVWDRASGQVVQVALAVACVPLLPVALRGWVLGVLVVVVLAAVVLLVAARREARAVLGGVWPEVVLLSALAATGHVSVFVVAARTAGVTVPVTDLAALALVVLLASAIPLGIAGWGPREGAAAAVFGATGLGAATGVEVAVVYGVLSLVATLPGLTVLRSTPTTGPERARGGRAWASTPTSS